jgi:hypothetical protein
VPNPYGHGALNIGATGRPLERNSDGQPGGDYVALLTRGGAQERNAFGSKQLSRKRSIE